MVDAEDVQVSYDVDPLAVAAFFVRADQSREEPDVTPLKLQKLMYLAQANFLASTGHRLYSSDMLAFRHGPVTHAVWVEFSGSSIINPEVHLESMRLDVPLDTEEFLSDVWSRFQDLSASQLRQLTHEQAPWSDNYVEGQLHTRIPDDEMVKYFRECVALEDRIFHHSFLRIDSAMLDDDFEADARLEAFLKA